MCVGIWVCDRNKCAQSGCMEKKKKKRKKEMENKTKQRLDQNAV